MPAETDALEKQLELLRVWKGEQGKRWATLISQGAAIVSLTGREVQQMAIDDLSYADCYFVDRKICELLETVSITMPDSILLPELVPSETGWVYLEKATSVGPISKVEKGMYGNPPRLKAFTWHREKLVEAIHRNSYIEGIALTFYEDGPLPLPLAVAGWDFGANWSSSWDKTKTTSAFKVEEEVLNLRFREIGRYVMTLFSFINQKLLVVSHQRANRATRKRYERERKIETPLIRVILLRAKKTASGKEQREVEWSCRWIVRGHWRQQWYPSLSNHKAIWIIPYIKGPEDKPLKKPATNLFAVVR